MRSGAESTTVTVLRLQLRSSASLIPSSGRGGHKCMRNDRLVNCRLFSLVTNRCTRVRVPVAVPVRSEKGGAEKSRRENAAVGGLTQRQRMHMQERERERREGKGGREEKEGSNRSLHSDGQLESRCRMTHMYTRRVMITRSQSHRTNAAQGRPRAQR